MRIPEIRQLKAAGYTDREIGQRGNLSGSTIAHRRARASIPVNVQAAFLRRFRAKHGPMAPRQLCAMVRQGYTLRQIGQHFGLSYERVRQLLTTYFPDVPRRRHGVTSDTNECG